MKFLLDESAEYTITFFLKKEGHDVTAIAYDHPLSLSDPEVLQIANIEKRILITNDRDFGELVFRYHSSHAGIIYFRLPLDTNAAKKTMWLKKILKTYKKDLAKFIVVTPRGIRIREPLKR